MAFLRLFAPLFLMMAATAGLAGRKCAICPERIVDAKTKTRYVWESREVQPTNVVCGVDICSYSRSRRRKETGGRIAHTMTWATKLRAICLMMHVRATLKPQPTAQRSSFSETSRNNGSTRDAFFGRRRSNCTVH
ncbi:hypothetical protein K438DRAFT_16535 [Mycena galopus ATCC 62051]|nr:hypothetical protein K438DRAFT_16535 [Mycena galopus ATCC 62051]